jgi:hypothetical protein
MSTLRLPAPAALLNGSPELDAVLDGACRKLHLFKTYRDLRAKRARLLRELAATDQELAKCAEPIRLAMLDRGIESVTLAGDAVQ